ncbi:MAG: hypothetical protein HYZ22_02220 [Chloroflexi bacterium]|nr:hypothetical protein [Chloroflexota bacterium]
MKYLKGFLTNILILFLIIIGMGIFTKIFYPEAMSVFPAIGEMITGMKLLPIVILMIIIAALPKRRR